VNINKYAEKALNERNYMKWKESEFLHRIAFIARMLAESSSEEGSPEQIAELRRVLEMNYMRGTTHHSSVAMLSMIAEKMFPSDRNMQKKFCTGMASPVRRLALLKAMIEVIEEFDAEM
jgi:hypothetical protein